MTDKLTNLYVSLELDDMKSFNKVAQTQLTKDDLFTDIEWAEGGLETNPHLTLMFSKSDTSHKCVKEISKQIIDKQLDLIRKTYININCIDVFSHNPDYDVMKYGVNTENLLVFRDFIRMQFGVESTFPTFSPHVTIAFLKKGVFDTLDLPKNINFDVRVSAVKVCIKGTGTEGNNIKEEVLIKL